MAGYDTWLSKYRNGTLDDMEEDNSFNSVLSRAAAAAGYDDDYFKKKDEKARLEKQKKDIEKKRKEEAAKPQGLEAALAWVGDQGGQLWNEAKKNYEYLGAGLGEVVGEVTGENEKIRKNYRDEQDRQTQEIVSIGKQLKDPNVDATKKDRLKKRLSALQGDNSIYEAATKRNDEIISRTDPAKGAAAVAGIGVDALSGGSLKILRGAKGAGVPGLSIASRSGTKLADIARGTGKLAKPADDVARSAKSRIARGAAGGAALEGAYSPIDQMAYNGEVTLEDTLTDVALGTAFGAGGGLLDAASTRKARKNAKKLAEDTERSVLEAGQGGSQAADYLDSEQRFRDSRQETVPETRLLGDGGETARARIQEIEDMEEAVRQGLNTNTTFQDRLPTSVDEAGGKNTTTAITNPLREHWAKHDAEIAPLEAKKQELTQQRSDMLSQEKYIEAVKNVEMKMDAVMKDAETLPPLRQAEYLRVKGSQLEQERATLDEMWANRDQTAQAVDDELDAIDAEIYNRERTAQMTAEELANSDAVKLAQRQEAVQNMSASDLRAMRKEKADLQRQLDDIEYSKTLDSGQNVLDVAVENPNVAKRVNENIDDSFKDYSHVDPDKTVGIFEGSLGTREIVMRKAGIKTWDEKIVPGQQKRDFALQEDAKQLETIAKSIGGNKDRATKIFNALDSGDMSKLDVDELAAAEWFKKSFAKLADLQGLPEESRLSNYITHLFEGKGAQRLQQAQAALQKGGFTKKQEARYRNIIYQSDPELLRLIRKNASGKVTNKFLEKRTGAEGYNTDPIQAYLVYAKKAYTKAYLEEGMNELADQKALVSSSMADYINDSINAIKGVPGEQKKWQEMINNSIIKLSGGKLDAGSFEKATRATTQGIYRGTLQYNFGTALTNMQQMANTYGEVGTKHFAKGLSEAMGKMKKGDTAELHQMGVLEGSLADALIGDKSLLKSVVGKAVEKSDKVGWYMFQTVEELNRASAYYAAKSKGLAKNMTEEEARQYAAKTVRKTQFKFSEIDTPPALTGPIAKNLTQLLTFSVKQAEYLKRSALSEEGMFQTFKNADGKTKVRLSPEGAMRMARLMIGYTVVGGTIGQITGVGNFDWDEVMDGDFSSLGNVAIENTPFLQNFMEGSAPMSPLVQLFAGNKTNVGVWNLLTGNNQYGQEQDRGEMAQDLLTKRVAPMFIPGGTQGKKTLEGVDSAMKGYSETDSGRVRFGIDNDYDRAMGSVFGQYNTSGGREYVENGLQSMSPTESQMFKDASPAKRKMYEEFFQAANEIQDSQGVSKEVTNIIKNEKNYNKAQRKVLEFNDSVDALFEKLFDEYNGMVPQELKDYVEHKKLSPLTKDLKTREK